MLLPAHLGIPHVERPLSMSVRMPLGIRQIRPGNHNRLAPQPRCKVKHVVQDAVPAIHGMLLSGNLRCGIPHQLSVIVIPSDADFPLVRPCVIDVGASRERPDEVSIRRRLRSEQKEPVIPIILLDFHHEFRIDSMLHRLFVGSPAADESHIRHVIPDALEMFPLRIQARPRSDDDGNHRLATAFEYLERHSILNPAMIPEHVALRLRVFE
jgi:hypothetical protein